jgi:hypothetical protein
MYADLFPERRFIHIFDYSKTRLNHGKHGSHRGNASAKEDNRANVFDWLTICHSKN